MIPESEERNDLLHNFIIMLSNLFGDYASSDQICDRLFKETTLPDLVFGYLPFKYADKPLLRTLARDLSYFIHNLSETDDPWCLH